MNEERKNGSIFSLYSREKCISHRDDQGREVKILLVKMTQRERSAAFDIYNDIRGKEEKRLKEDEEKNKTQSKIINAFSKEQLIQGVLDFEKIQREQYANLYPFEDEEKLNKEEKRKRKGDLLEKWADDRRKALEAEKIEDLRKIVTGNTFESLSIIEAGRMFDYASLSFICRHPETKERIFKDYTKLEQVRDRRVLDWLLEELRKFREEEFGTDEKAREEAQSPDFTSSGESQKPSEESPPSKT